MPWGLDFSQPGGGNQPPQTGWGLNVDPEPSLWERLKSYQKTRLPSFGLAMARNITSLPNIPRDLAEMSQSVATSLTPGFMKPFVERRYEGHKSLIDTLTPDALSESGDVWSTAADAAQSIKESRGRAAGIPGWGLALENLAEEGTALALDPLELAPGGMLLAGMRAASRGARGAKKAIGVVDEAADLAKALRPESARRIPSHAGQAGESPEAIARVARGERYYRVSSGGEVTPIPNTVDAVDMRVNPGEAKVRLTADGGVEIEQGGRGGRAQSEAIARLRRGEVEEIPAPRVREGGGEAYELDLGEGLPSEAVSLSSEPPSKPGFLRRWFTKEGQFAAAPADLRNVLYDKTMRVKHNVAGHRALQENNVRRLDRAIKEAGVEPGALTPQVRQYLLGDRAVELPPGVQKAADDMREHMDSLALKAIEDGNLLSDEMAMVYGDNLGRHLTRSYEMHYARNADEYIASVRGSEKWERAYEYLAGTRQFKGAPPERITGALEEMLRAGPESLYISQREGVPSLAGSLSKARKEIPEPLRALMGEILDPKVQYARTVERLSHDTALSQALQEIEKVGRGRIFFDEAVEGYSVPIPGEVGRSPLGGKYTSSGMTSAISGFQDIVSREPGLVRDLWGKYLALNTGVKAGLVVGNPAAHVRNPLAWPFIALANGNVKAVKNLPTVTRAARGTLGKEAGARALGMSVNELDDLFAEMTRLGIGGQSVIGGHVVDFGKTVGRESVGTGLVGKGSRAIGKGIEKTKRVYALEDDIPKGAIYLEELSKYRRAFPDMPEEELKRLVAGNVRDTTPTWDQIPEAFRELGRDFPLVGAYPGFYQQMVQSTYNTIRLGIRESKSSNKALQAIGRRRLGGLLTTLSLPTAASIGTGVAAGVGYEKWKGRREVQAPWNRNSEMLYFEGDAPGEFSQVNIGYVDPYGLIKAPAIAAIAEGSVDESRWQDIAKEVVWAGLEPFLGLEPMVDVATEIATRRNPTDSVLSQVGAGAGTASKRLLPVYRQGRNIAQSFRGTPSRSGQTRKPWQEIAATFGLRVSDQNMLTALHYDSRDFAQERNDLLRKVRYETTEPKYGAAEDAYKAMERLIPEQEKKWREVYYPRMKRKVEALKAEGVPERAIYAALEGALPNDLARRLVAGAESAPLFNEKKRQDWMKLRYENRSAPWWEGATP